MSEQKKRNSRKVLYVEMSPEEHAVLRVEAAITGATMGDIVRSKVIVPLRQKQNLRSS